MNLDCCNNCVFKAHSSNFCNKLGRNIPNPSFDICSSHSTHF